MEKLIEALSGLTIGEIAKCAGLLLVAILSLFEFTKIKVNPISAIFRWIGNKINAPLFEKIDTITANQASQEHKLSDLQDSQDDNEIDRIRWEILDFANSCRHGVKHTLDEFDHIIELNEKYHRILDRRKLTNGKIDLEYSYIVDIYKQCQEKNSFL